MVTFPGSTSGTVWAVPDSLRTLGRQLATGLRGSPAADIVESCLTNTWTTSMSWGTEPSAAPEVFVRTGDIPAMWLRDSTAQVRPYLAVATDPQVGDVLAGVSRRQIRCVLLDPYANAFNDGPTGAHGEPGDRPGGPSRRGVPPRRLENRAAVAGGAVPRAGFALRVRPTVRPVRR